MDFTQISDVTSIAVNTISTFVNSYHTLRKSNIEKYFERLNESGQDLKTIGNNDELKRRFYYIIDEVARERNKKKIKAWKNATISLATEKVDFDKADGHFQTLEHLTYFDLTVLYQIYTTNFNNSHFEKELIKFFRGKEVEKEYLLRSLRQLAQFNLISEQFETTEVVAGAKAHLQDFYYSKNQLGKDFLKFVYRDVGF